MKTWKIIILWIAVAALVISIVVCGKKAEQAKGDKAPKEEALSSVPDETTPKEETEVKEKPEEAKTAAVEAAEAKKSAAKSTETTEPKPAKAVPAETIKEITRDNAAAIIELAKGGKIVIEFYPKDAPNTVDNFIKLAREGFYDGLDFHRVIKGFMAQGGGSTTRFVPPIKAEFNTRMHLEGTVAMARGDDPDSATSQFYICFEPQPHLDGNYTVFGQVIQGMDVVHTIEQGDVMKKVNIVDKASVMK